MLNLRWYQYEAVNKAIDFLFTKQGNPLISLPCGTGKSLVIAALIYRAQQLVPGTRILQLVHVENLVEGNYKELLAFWPNVVPGVYCAGLKRRDTQHDIIFGSCDSVVNCVDLFGHRDLLIIDETDLVAPEEEKTYGKIITGLKQRNPNLRIVGLSATVWRTTKGSLTGIKTIRNGKTTDESIFTELVYDMCSMENFNVLMSQGYLKPLHPRPVTTALDVSGVKISSTGDYAQGELQAAVNTDELNYHICQETAYYGQERSAWLCFASGIEHAENLAEIWQGMNIEAVAIHSKMKPDLVREHIRNFKAGKIRCLVSRDKITTGFNVPWIDLLVIARPTKSSRLWVQMLGRGTRPSPERCTDCVVLDFAHNADALGPINDPVIPGTKRPNDTPGVAPIKVCPACGEYCFGGQRFCACGHEFEMGGAFDKLQQHASIAELIAEQPKTITWYDVDFMYVSKHQKKNSNKPPSLRLGFKCGNKTYNDFLHLELTGYARKRSIDKYLSLYGGYPPASVDEALTKLAGHRGPKRVQIWHKKDFDEVMSYGME